MLQKNCAKKNKARPALTEEPVLTRPEALQAAAVAAFNVLLDDEEFYIKHQEHISMPESGPAFSVRESLAASGLLARDDAGTWRLARRPRESESEDLRWFNIALLTRMYPEVLTKNQQRDYSMLMLIPLLIIICYLLKGIADFGQHYLIGTAGNLAIMNLRSDLYRHIQDMSLAFFSRVTTGEILSRVSNDVSLLRRNLSSVIIRLSRNIFMVIALSAVVIYQNWQMAVLCLIVMPTFSYPIIRFGRKARTYSLKTQEQMGGVATFLDETISGNQTVKSYCMEPYENARFIAETERLYRLSVKSVKISALSSPDRACFRRVSGCRHYLLWGLASHTGAHDSGSVLFLHSGPGHAAEAD